MIYHLKAAYRQRGTWVMNSAVARQVRKLKDANGPFLWTDRLAASQASPLLGYPLAIAESMPRIAASAHPIASGDFERASILCENSGLPMTLDDNITTPGRVKFYIRRRLGGTAYDNNAVRFKVAMA